MTFDEAMKLPGVPLEWKRGGEWVPFDPSKAFRPYDLVLGEFRHAPRKTRIQEMAGEAYIHGTPDFEAFGERVVREVCKYLRAKSAGPLVRDVEYEFLGGAK